MAASIAILACFISASRSKNSCSLLFTIPKGSNPCIVENMGCNVIEVLETEMMILRVK